MFQKLDTIDNNLDRYVREANSGFFTLASGTFLTKDLYNFENVLYLFKFQILNMQIMDLYNLSHVCSCPTYVLVL